MAKSMSHSEAHCCYVTMYFVVKTAEFPLHYNISTSVSPPKFGCTSHECHFQLLVSSTCSIWGTHELSAGTSAMASPAWADGNGRVKFSDLWRNMFGAFVQPSIYSIIFKTLRTLRYVFICFLTNAQRYLTAFTKWEAAQCHANVQAAWQHFLFFSSESQQRVVNACWAGAAKSPGFSTWWCLKPQAVRHDPNSAQLQAHPAWQRVGCLRHSLHIWGQHLVLGRHWAPHWPCPKISEKGYQSKVENLILPYFLWLPTIFPWR